MIHCVRCGRRLRQRSFIAHSDHVNYIQIFFVCVFVSSLEALIHSTANDEARLRCKNCIRRFTISTHITCGAVLLPPRHSALRSLPVHDGSGFRYGAAKIVHYTLRIKKETRSSPPHHESLFLFFLLFPSCTKNQSQIPGHR